MATRKLSSKDAKRVRGGAVEIENLVDAQARGELVQGVPTEGEAPQEAKLDRRRSKRYIKITL